MAATGMVLGAAYAMVMYSTSLWNSKPHFISTFSDISRREFFMFLPFVFSTFGWVLSRTVFEMLYIVLLEI